MPEFSKNKKPVTMPLAMAAFAMLVGIVLLGYGRFFEKPSAFYAGLVITLGGVLVGIVRVAIKGDA